MQKLKKKIERDQEELAEYQKFNPYFEHKAKPDAYTLVSVKKINYITWMVNGNNLD